MGNNKSDENGDLNQVKESWDETTQTHAESSSTEMLRNQMQQSENEKNKLLQKYKELQDENCDLRSKVIGLKNLSYSANNSGMMSEARSDAQLAEDKDFEIGRLNRIIEELVKANEEKDKRVDELTRQVHRFKRIQEIVLSAQNTNFKNKSKLRPFYLFRNKFPTFENSFPHQFHVLIVKILPFLQNIYKRP